jgi:hypothetical protein
MLPTARSFDKVISFTTSFPQRQHLISYVSDFCSQIRLTYLAENRVCIEGNKKNMFFAVKLIFWIKGKLRRCCRVKNMNLFKFSDWILLTIICQVGQYCAIN